MNPINLGLLVGTVLFAFPLTPSLMPRPFFIQGILYGLSFSAGYGLGVAAVALWNYLQLPVWRKRTAIIVKSIAALLCVEMALDLPPSGPGCASALNDPHGRSLRIEWTRPVASEVAAVARSLWEAVA